MSQVLVTKIKDFINRINFGASVLFASLGLFLCSDGDYKNGLFYILLSLSLLASYYIYLLSKELKDKIEKICLALLFISEDSKEADLKNNPNKVMSLFFLLDMNLIKDKKKSLSNHKWIWSNKHPISLIVHGSINAFNEFEKYDFEKKQKLNLEEKKLIQDFIISNINLSELEIMDLIISSYPKLLTLEDGSVINPEVIQ